MDLGLAVAAGSQEGGGDGSTDNHEGARGAEGPDLILHDDGDGPPLPPDFVDAATDTEQGGDGTEENSSHRQGALGVLEIFQDDDHPQCPQDMMVDQETKGTDKDEVKGLELGLHAEEGGPVHRHVAVESGEGKRKSAARTPALAGISDLSPSALPPDQYHDGVESVHADGVPDRQPQLTPEQPRHSTSASRNESQTEVSPTAAIHTAEVSPTTDIHVEAVPVDDPVYDAVAVVDDKTASPWWKRHQCIISLLSIALVGAIAAAVRVSVGRSEGDENGSSMAGPGPILPEKQVEQAPCTKSLRSAFETDCDGLCMPAIGMDGDAAAVASVDHGIHFFSNIYGIIQPIASIDIDYEPTTLAMSGGAVVVGATSENDDKGSVYIYEKDPFGNWSLASIFVPDDIGEGAKFGASVSIDGDIMAIGAPDDGDEKRGSMYVLRWNVYRQTWVQEAKLSPPLNFFNLEHFGISVSVQGGTIIVGDDLYGLNKGGAFLYMHDAQSNVWKLQYDTIQLFGNDTFLGDDPINNPDCDAYFAQGLASTQGGDLLVGCPGDNEEEGAIFSYDQPAVVGQYVFRQKISGTGAMSLDSFGGWDKIAVDGKLMIVGTFRQYGGRAYVFMRMNGTWVEVDSVDAPASAEYFGARAAMSNDVALISSERNAYFYSLEDCVPTSCVGPLKTAFKNDCDGCSPSVAMDGDTSVIARDATDIRFYHNEQSESTTAIEIDYAAAVISVSGSTVIVGAPSENNNTGSVYVYEKDGVGVWSQKSKILPSDLVHGAKFGSAVAIDNRVFLVGAIDDGDEGKGSAYIYRRTETGWVEELKLVPDDPLNQFNDFGSSVSLKHNTAVVGDSAYWFGRGESNVPGGGTVAYEYDVLSREWKQFDFHLRSSGCDRLGGGSLGLTHSGGVLFGCPGEDKDTGAVFFFEISEISGQYVQKQRITGSNSGPGDFFGSLGHIAVDGNMMIVGTRKQREGKAYVFIQTESGWIEVAVIDGPLASEFFGEQVSFSGNRALISSDRNAYSYSLGRCFPQSDESSITDSDGQQLAGTLDSTTPPTPCPYAKLKNRFLEIDCNKCYPEVAVGKDVTVVSKEFDYIQLIPNDAGSSGQSIDIDYYPTVLAMSDGNLVVGAYTANSRTGALYIYERNNVSQIWGESANFLPSDIFEGAMFGFSVSIDVDVVVVGAPQDREGNVGSAYVFRRNQTAWADWYLDAKLRPSSDEHNLSHFGVSVSVKGSTIVVGDSGYDGGGVLVYEYDSAGGAWTLNEIIMSPDCDSSFGESTVLTQTGLVVGCTGEKNATGALFYYTKPQKDSPYTLRQKVTASDGLPGDYFGEFNNVATDGNVLIAVAGREREEYGRAYIFAQTDDTWYEVAKVADNYDARKVALVGDTAVVTSDGNAYAYELDKC